MREPTVRQCEHCDFGSGTRGMDRCARCSGTGSIFRVAGMTYPNTKTGYEAAHAALNASKIGDVE